MRKAQDQEFPRCPSQVRLAAGASPFAIDPDRQSDQEIIADITGDMALRVQIIGHKAVTCSESSLITRCRRDLHLSPQNHHQLSARWGVQGPVGHPLQELGYVHGRHWNVSKRQSPPEFVIPALCCRKIDPGQVGGSQVIAEYPINRHGESVLWASEVNLEKPLGVGTKHFHPIFGLKMLEILFEHLLGVRPQRIGVRIICFS